MRGPFSRTWSAQMMRPFFKWMTSARVYTGESTDTQALTNRMTGGRIEPHSRTRGVATQVTKGVARTRRKLYLAVALSAAVISAVGQDVPTISPPLKIGGAPASHSASENLFLQLSSVGLDSSRVYRARELS